MPIIRVGKHRQVVLPLKVCQEVGIDEGQYLEVTVKNGTITMKRKVLIKKNSTTTTKANLVSIWREKAKKMKTSKLSKEGEKMVAEALKDIETGHFKAFDNVEDLIRDLKA